MKLKNQEMWMRAMSKYKIPEPYNDLISPAEFEALADLSEDSPDIFSLLNAWVNPVLREEMQEWANSFIEEQVEYQIRDKNVLRVAIYGPAGKGKSELAISLMFDIIANYHKYGVDIIGWPLIARSPSDANDVFAEHTKRGNTIGLVLDEKERESGTGSITNLHALVQNLDTMRVLRHSLIMLAITKEEFGKLISRCQLIFRAIFKDIDNCINWCIMYINDMESKNLIPLAIVGIPLHPHEWFRKWYEKDKMTQQVSLTGGGGRRQADPKMIISTAAELIKYVKRHKIINPKATTLKELLLTEVPNTLIGEEKEAVVARVRRLLKQKRGDTPSEPEDAPVYDGQTADIRSAVEDMMMSDYGIEPGHIEALQEYVSGETQSDIGHRKGVTQTTIHNWIDGIRKVIGYAFEDVYAAMRRKEFPDREIKVFGKNTPEPDLLEYDIDGNILEVRSLKCRIEKRNSFSVPKRDLGEKELELWEDKIPLTVVMYDYVADKITERKYTGQNTMPFRKER